MLSPSCMAVGWGGRRQEFLEWELETRSSPWQAGTLTRRRGEAGGQGVGDLGLEGGWEGRSR